MLIEGRWSEGLRESGWVALVPFERLVVDLQRPDGVPRELSASIRWFFWCSLLSDVARWVWLFQVLHGTFRQSEGRMLQCRLHIYLLEVGAGGYGLKR